tara:strand:+ start:779 stop:1012 length:234 start_codon:yes stop_codon:yes gene_type:complete
MEKIELTFINYNNKDIINVIVKSTITDAYIHEQGHLKVINTNHPNIEWLTLLAEKETNINLNKYNLDGVNTLNKLNQ